MTVSMKTAIVVLIIVTITVAATAAISVVTFVTITIPIPVPIPSPIPILILTPATITITIIVSGLYATCMHTFTCTGTGGAPVLVWEGEIQASGLVMRKAENQHLMRCRLLVRAGTWPPTLDLGWSHPLVKHSAAHTC